MTKISKLDQTRSHSWHKQVEKSDLRVVSHSASMATGLATYIMLKTTGILNNTDKTNET
jgi:hypothetical protein